MTHARRAVSLREKHEGDPTALAEARFLLAKMLGASPRNRGEAIALAKAAHEQLAKTGSEQAAEVSAWLRRQGG